MNRFLMLVVLAGFALAALATHPHDAAAPCEVINGLINNLRYQQQQANNNIREL